MSCKQLTGSELHTGGLWFSSSACLTLWTLCSDCAVFCSCLCCFHFSGSQHSSKRSGPLVRLEFAQISFWCLSPRLDFTPVLFLIMYFGAEVRVAFVIEVYHLLYKAGVSWKHLGPSESLCSAHVSEISTHLQLFLLSNPTWFYSSCYCVHL